MSTRVFVSCGQRPEELTTADQIGEVLARRGFDFYIAKNVQSLIEINSVIIRELKNSDNYLFINFRRDLIEDGKFRGSLFSNQELAIAYALNFENILVVNQTEIKREGMLGYFGCNTDEFEDYSDCLTVVEKALTLATWKPDYSRRLKAQGLRLSDSPIIYGSPYGTLTGYFLYVDVFNGRPDIAALETTARLVSYRLAGSEHWIPCPIRSPLKAAGRAAFSHTVFPKSHEAFDLLCVGEFSNAPREQHAYLNSALDVFPIPHLPIAKGIWELEYQFYAIDFPLLTILIELTWTSDDRPSARLLKQELS